jgi:hypothetical protein
MTARSSRWLASGDTGRRLAGRGDRDRLRAPGGACALGAFLDRLGAGRNPVVRKVIARRMPR